jgi:hypothetical protein
MPNRLAFSMMLLWQEAGFLDLSVHLIIVPVQIRYFEFAGMSSWLLSIKSLIFAATNL